MPRPATSRAHVPVLCSGLAEIAPLYRGFLVDLWGTLHDGEHAFEGAIIALKRLRGHGIRVCLLSNSPRPASMLAVHLARMGIGDDCYDDLMSSGEATFLALRRRRLSWARTLGRRYCLIGPPDTENLLHGLAYERVDKPKAADFVLTTGSVPGTGLAAYEATLRDCLRRRLPMICANPDRCVFSGGRRVMCAGAIAQRYGELGGTVRQFGKPQRAIYRHCLRLLHCEPEAALMVGDGLETDIAGARRAGLAAAFIPGPLYAETLGGDSTSLRAEKLMHLFDQAGCWPQHVLPAFRW